MLSYTMQIAVRCLKNLVQPVRQFDVGIATQLTKRRRTFNTSERRNPQLAKQRLTRNQHVTPFVEPSLWL